LIIIALFVAFSINPILGVVGIFAIIFFLKKNPKYLTSYLSNYLQATNELRGGLTENKQPILEKATLIKSAAPLQIPGILFNQTKVRLEKRKNIFMWLSIAPLRRQGKLFRNFQLRIEF